jgi:hypothetical protein
MFGSDWVHLDVERITAASSSAFLCLLAAGESVWIPYSQICDVEDYRLGQSDATISVSRWWAEQRGLA